MLIEINAILGNLCCPLPLLFLCVGLFRLLGASIRGIPNGLVVSPRYQGKSVMYTGNIPRPNALSPLSVDGKNGICHFPFQIRIIDMGNKKAVGVSHSSCDQYASAPADLVYNEPRNLGHLRSYKYMALEGLYGIINERLELWGLVASTARQDSA
ncbi:hypothetical protein C8J56DRAFT_896571 [Mycena floridula]|nr:hypothetical protein C8J56DRAFT_896571 [Mycena floridula]